MGNFNIAVIKCITILTLFFSVSGYARVYMIDNSYISEEEVELLAKEKKGYGCYWMDNPNENFRWFPAEKGGMYHGEGIKQCYRLDSCHGGKGDSNGGCYKWALSSKAKGVDWRAKLALMAILEGEGYNKILLTDKSSCPENYSAVTFDEAAQISYQICKTLAPGMEVIRLDGSALMLGAHYKCRMRKIDKNKIERESLLCKRTLRIDEYKYEWMLR